jgi:hypothetical protein
LQANQEDLLFLLLQPVDKLLIMKMKKRPIELIENDILKASAYIISFSVALILLSAVVYIYNDIRKHGFLENPNTLATLGDFIGGVFGTFFSLVTVLLVWLAFQYQKKETEELAKNGKEQIEIQALSALMVHYTNTIARLEIDLDFHNGYVGDPNHEEDVITPIRSEIEHYTNLLNLSEKRLTSKIEPLFQE